MRRWLSDLLRSLWLAVEIPRRLRKSQPYTRDPFRGALALVKVGGHVVTRLREDDLDALAALGAATSDVVVEADAPSGLLTAISGPRMAERLELLGIDERVVRRAFTDQVNGHVEYLNGRVADPELKVDPDFLLAQAAFYQHFTVEEWIERIRSAAGGEIEEEEGFFVYPEPDDFRWLNHWLLSMESRAAVRLALLAFPAAEVVVHFRPRDDVQPQQLGEISAQARQSLLARGDAFLPLLVLTEGSTDAELLSGALEVLFPHLTDLVTFLDFDALASGRRVNGGAKDIAPKIRTLVGSGAKQRIVAVYDK